MMSEVFQFELPDGVVLQVDSDDDYQDDIIEIKEVSRTFAHVTAK